MVAEFDKKAMETKADVHPQSSTVLIKNSFQTFAADIDSDINAETEIESVEEALAESEAHRSLKWDMACFPKDLAERVHSPGPLLFLQELNARVDLWYHSQALMITYGDLLGGFSNGLFANHLSTLQQVIGETNWASIYSKGQVITENSIVPLEMRTVLFVALSNIKQQLVDIGMEDQTSTESFQTVLRKRIKKKPFKKK